MSIFTVKKLCYFLLRTSEIKDKDKFYIFLYQNIGVHSGIFSYRWICDPKVLASTSSD